MGKKPWRLIIFIVLFISGCVSIVPIQAGYGDKIRVLVSKGVNDVTVKGPGGELHIRKTAPGAVTVNGREKRLPLMFYPEPDEGLIYLNGRPYRGHIEVMDSRDGLLVVDELFIESYLVGIINNEISSKWHREAIKAQAVIARTYALHERARKENEPYHIEGSVMGQVYNGSVTEDPASLSAVRETSGEVLLYGGSPALTVYHSNAGGMTDSSKEVWAHYYPYLNPVKSPYDKGSANFLWEYSIPAGPLRASLNNAGYRIGNPEAIGLEEVTSSGRAKKVFIKDSEEKRLRLTGEDLRRILGYGNLKSTIFEVTGTGGVFTFRGRGSGHGVGLSQWGAKGMAENGYSYREILRHFYPGTVLEKAY